MSRATNGLQLLLLSLLLLISTTAHAQQYNNSYSQKPIRYYGAQFQTWLSQGLRDKALKETLNTILKSNHYAQADAPDVIGGCPTNNSRNCYRHTSYSYTQARKILLGQLHLIQLSSGYAIRGVYCNTYYGRESFGKGRGPKPGRIPNHNIVNVEHTWPQSRFSGRYRKVTQKTDLHHLYPSNSQMNSTRGNMNFGMVEKATASTCPAFKIGWPSGQHRKHAEPPMSHKGNVARAMMYFSIRYELHISPYQEAILKIWNRQDPVDAEEYSRAEAIFNIQGVRNPFVDFPGLADLISDF